MKDRKRILYDRFAEKQNETLLLSEMVGNIMKTKGREGLKNNQSLLYKLERSLQEGKELLESIKTLTNEINTLEDEERS